MYTLNIHDLEVVCVIGCLPEERLRAQPLRLHLSLSLDAEQAAIADDPALTWDYTELAARLRFALVEGRFRLIEAAARSALAAVFTPQTLGDTRPEIQGGRLRLSKPGAFPGQGHASVQLAFAGARAASSPQEWGTRWALEAGGRVRIAQLQLHAGAYLTLAPEPGRRTSLLPLTEGLSLESRALSPLRTLRVQDQVALQARSEATFLLLDAPVEPPAT